MEEKKISKEEYLNALETVEIYHRQVFNEINTIRTLETMLSILIKNPKISRKLENILSEYINSYGNVSLVSVVRPNFLKIRNAGKKSWDEFVFLRDEYLKSQ